MEFGSDGWGKLPTDPGTGEAIPPMSPRGYAVCCGVRLTEGGCPPHRKWLPLLLLRGGAVGGGGGAASPRLIHVQSQNYIPGHTAFYTAMRNPLVSPDTRFRFSKSHVLAVAEAPVAWWR